MADNHVQDKDLQIEEAAHALMRAFVKLRRIHTQSSHPGEADHFHRNGAFGIKPSEAMILFAVNDRSAQYPEGIRVSDLSGIMHVKPPSVTSIINSLEEKGLIIRKSDPGDRRITRIVISEEGDKILNEGKKHFLSKIRGVVEYLGVEKSLELAGLLGDVFEYISDKHEKD
jgi:DNA-binding MarR family transcriptional regulator